MEENTDSSNSTLTDCANSARKKKSDCDSARSYFHSRMPLPLKMDDRHLSELFQQLVYVRFLQPPYDKYGGWKDGRLWTKIVDAVYKHDPFLQPSVRRVMATVSKYCEKYNKDSQLHDMEDSSLKKNICLVFGPMITDTGCLKAEFLENLQDMGNSSVCSKGTQPPFQVKVRSDSYSPQLARAMEKENRAPALPFIPELGYMGGLSLQFGGDMDHLQINAEDRLLFFPKYGPTSTMYVSMARQGPAHRRNMLRSLLDDLKKNHSQPSASSRKIRKS
ncbi:unnamed protein product [Rhodiola kirilowii]